MELLTNIIMLAGKNAREQKSANVSNDLHVYPFSLIKNKQTIFQYVRPATNSREHHTIACLHVYSFNSEKRYRSVTERHP